MDKKLEKFNVTEWTAGLERSLKNRLIVGYTNKNLYGHVTIHFLNGRKHYIEISEKSAHEIVK